MQEVCRIPTPGNPVMRLRLHRLAPLLRRACLPIPTLAQNPDRLPDLDVLTIERTPRYPGYRPEYNVKGLEGVPVLIDRKTGKPLSTAQARSIKRWPAPSEIVTFTGHGQNRG